jgi:ribonucleoside-diphosphate reductase alpha chain
LREGGGHRSALLYCLDWRHADLLEFLSAKLDNKELTNANISVLVDDEFFKLLDEKGEIIFKWQGEERGRIAAQDVWDKIIQNAWESGDPGLLNMGLMNEQNTLSYARGGEISSTNPCAEATLEEYGCCCLGAINLHTHITNGEIDWDMLEETIAMGVRFLDNVLDQNNYPLPVIQETSQKHRRIGLGVMGLHDMLLELDLKYSNQAARNIVDETMGFIKKQAYHASITLAIEKGSFHAFDADKHTKTGFVKQCLGRRHHRLIKEHGLRNCAILSAAPTGTISIVAGCSSGIEPLFYPIYERHFNRHKDMHKDEQKNKAVEIVVHPLLREFLDTGKSIKYFQGAHDILPEDHLAMQVVCQKHIDNSISKTINIPSDYSVEQLSKDIRKYIKELKGITVYRDGSKGESPLVPLSLSKAKKHLEQMKEQAAVNDCPSGTCDIQKGSD